MAFQQRFVFVTMVVIFIAVRCKSYSDKDIEVKGCDEKGLCEKKPAIYNKVQDKIDRHMEGIYETWKPRNDLGWSISCKNTANNCQSKSKMFKPFIYKGNGTKLVVQSKFYEQKFEITTCKKRVEKNMEGAKCFESMNLGDVGYKGTCRPKQTTIKLYVYDINKEQIQRVPVEIDVCCTCDISSIYYYNKTEEPGVSVH